MNGLLVAADLALLVVMCTVPALLVRIFLDISQIGAWCGEHWRLWRYGPQPVSRPLECTAATLRRLRAMLEDPRHLSAARYQGIQLAYDRTLSDACETLGIDEELCAVHGFAHSVERIRIEAELERAGLTLTLPSPRHHPC